MSGSKVKELRAVAPHVHCFVCGCVVRDGEGGMGEVLQPAVVSATAASSIGFTRRAVSLCSTCLAGAEKHLQQAEQAANARGRLVVARAQVPS